MSALRLKLVTPPHGRIDLSAIVPSKLAGLSDGEIERIEIAHQLRGPVLLGDVFSLSRAGEMSADLVIEGSTVACDGIGDGLAGETIVVEGDAGAYTGRRMTKGRIDVRGKVGDYLGAAMKGGLISVRGAAGDFAGGVLPGDKNGMAGGTLVVEGPLGERAGDRMRRGSIITRGRCGADAGSRMLGGTIIAEGGFGPKAGVMLRRGTLIGPSVERMLDTFADCGRHDLGILNIMSRYFAEALGPLAPKPFPAMVRRFAGDLATLGKGEILITT